MGCAAGSVQESQVSAQSKQATTGGRRLSSQPLVGKLSLPPPTSLSYYGLFNQHYFQPGEEECSEELALATRVGHVTAGGSGEIWLGCFFKSCLDGRPRDDRPIDVLVTLDISSSMNSGFSQSSQKAGSSSKLNVAKEAMVGLLGKLRETDRFGLATFNTSSSVVQPLRFMKYLDRSLIRNSLDGINPVGTTSIQAAKAAATDVVKGATGHENRSVHRRLIFITDEEHLSTANMREIMEEQAKSSVFVSFLCLGMEFNSEFAEEVSRHRGANYFSITREDDMRRVVLQDFDFNFIPAAFDLELAGQSDAFDLLAVYGSPYDATDDPIEADPCTPGPQRFSPHEIAKQAKDFIQTHSKRSTAAGTGTMPSSPAIHQLFMPISASARTLIRVDTTFPAALAKDGSMPGHLVLLRLKPREPGGGGGTVRLMLRHTSAQTGEECTRDIEVPLKEPESSHTMDPVLAKAVSLQRYMEVCKLYVTSACERSPRLADLQVAMSQLEALLAEFEAQPEFDNQCPGVRDDLKIFVAVAKKHLAEVKPGLLARPFAPARSVSKGSLKEKEETLVSF